MALRIGDLAVDKVYVGNDEVSKVYVGSDLVWSSFSPAGMDKSGTQAVSGANVKLTGWIARAGFAATIANNGLVMQSTAVVKIYWDVNANMGKEWHETHILKNGVVLATGDGPSVINNVSVVPGDVLTVELSNGYFAGVTITSAYIYTSLT